MAGQWLWAWAGWVATQRAHGCRSTPPRVQVNAPTGAGQRPLAGPLTHPLSSTPLPTPELLSP
jgi:hypothetical protein